MHSIRMRLVQINVKRLFVSESREKTVGADVLSSK